MPVQQRNYPAMYHRAQTGCDLGWGAMRILTGFFLSSLSVTDEHRGLLNPVVNYVGTGESYSHKEKQWGGKEDADECRSCMFLEIWPPQGYALTALN